MDIALFNERITIQKNAVVTDEIGNHTNAWSDYYECHATVGGSSGGGQNGAENDEAGQTLDVSDLAFSIRWCSKVSAIDVTGYRVIFHGGIYDIISIDYMNFKKRLLKLKCRKARR